MNVVVYAGMEVVRVQFRQPPDIRAGEARVLHISGLDDGDTFVFLGDADDVKRVHRAGADIGFIPWDVQQIVNDMCDPHAVLCDG